MMKLNKKQMRALNKVAREWHGCRFNELDILDQDEVYIYAKGNWLL